MTDGAGNTATKQRGKPFRKGQSGNPAGKPKGTRNKATLLVEQLIDGEAEALARRAVELGKLGHPVLLKALLDRVAPPRRDRPVPFTLPPIAKVQDLPKATAALLAAVAAGELTPSEAVELGKLVEAHCRAVETAELERRLAVLEQEGSRTNA